MAASLIVEFSHVGRGDVAFVGSKGANLGELTQGGFPVPPGFIVTTAAFGQFVRSAKLAPIIRKLMTGLVADATAPIQRAARELQKAVLAAPFPKELAQAIEEHYQRLVHAQAGQVAVAVRSSITAAHYPDTTIAANAATFLEVIGAPAVIRAVHHAWAALFEPQALYYRLAHHYDLADFTIAIPVQQMVQSTKAGVVFTINPNSGNSDEVIIEAIWGLGLALVMGAVTPDRYVVSKADEKILSRLVSAQPWQMVRNRTGHRGGTRHCTIPKPEQRQPKLSDQEILALATLATRVEEHYHYPQNIEWTIDEQGKLWLVDSTPLPQRTASLEIPPPVTSSAAVLLKGLPASFGFASGPVRIIHTARQLEQVKDGEIVVAEQTNPSYVPALERAAGIITDAGGMTSHAVLMARELGLPCVVGTGQATQQLKNGVIVTIDGRAGVVYKGKVSVQEKQLSANNYQLTAGGEAPLVTATRVYVNLAEPDRAAAAAALPVDGVGLLRAEFMFAKFGMHPRYALAEKKDHQLVRHLTDGIRTIASAFAGRPVMYRASDLKTNEYRHLEGGSKVEPKEENPMLGYRGALRYLREPELFRLELAAVKAVRDSYELRNVSLMIPFVRTLDEWHGVRQLVEESGLVADHDFKLHMMVEVPAVVLLLEQFLAAGVAGISIGSNDLTQSLLAADRDNARLAATFDERHPAVLAAMRHVVTVARRHHLPVSICGQAAAVYPEVLEELIEAGITSVSVSPDQAVQTRRLVASIERRLLLDALTQTAHGAPHPLWH
ncbi:phosphoenolpyruvate synthase [Candidatus Berkelbacteria bacterium]|nr:phosphoenolpyruvate synthase [Candidatus Berkelbacteria bacterium]